MYEEIADQTEEVGRRHKEAKEILGKRTSGPGEIGLDSGLGRQKSVERTPWQICGRLFKICPWRDLLAQRSARLAERMKKESLRKSFYSLPKNRFFQLLKM